MRIISWNCAAASQQKIDLLLGLNPDVAVVPECSEANIEALKAKGYSAFWLGQLSTKGIGVIAGNGWKLTPRLDNLAALKTVAAFDVSGPANFTLVAVWTQSTKGYRGYAAELHAIATHPEWFRNGPVVLAGDLNSNSRWDSECKPNHHSSFIELMRGFGLESAYHLMSEEAQGAEKRPTHYHQWNSEKGFHLDYVFVPAEWRNRISAAEVGTYEQWGKISDHCPVIVSLHEPTSEGSCVAAE